MSFAKRTLKLVKFFDQIFADLAGIMLLIMLVLTVVSVTSRFLIGSPVPDAEGISEMLLVGVVFLPLAYCQLLRQHVEVTLFTDSLSLRLKKHFIRLGYVVGILGFAVLLYAMAKGALTAYQRNDSYLGVNMIVTWPARSIAAFGIAVMLLRLIVDFAYSFNCKENSKEDENLAVSTNKPG